jgi:DNA repair protein RadC
MADANKLMADNFIKGITTLTGISQRKLQKYASENSIFNILEHPLTVEPNRQQLDKISQLNEFIASYNILKMYEKDNKLTLNSSNAAGQYFQSMLGGIKNKEQFLVAFLDSSNSLIESRVMSEGSIAEAAVYPREILKAALASDCKSMILAHNHPGGSQQPSKQDIDLTQKLCAIFTPLEIKVLDHVIVAGINYTSMAERGIMPDGRGIQPSYEPIPLSNDANNSRVVENQAEFQDDGICREGEEAEWVLE